jgi:hypothetical protein
MPPRTLEQTPADASSSNPSQAALPAARSRSAQAPAAPKARPARTPGGRAAVPVELVGGSLEPSAPKRRSGAGPKAARATKTGAGKAGQAAARPSGASSAKPSRASKVAKAPKAAKTAKAVKTGKAAETAKTSKATRSAAAGAAAGPRQRRTKARAGGGRGPSRSAKAVYTAESADPHELYQLAVQSPGVDAAFLAKLFKKLRGREARHVREDFCGTAYFVSAWLRRNRENTAEGYDIDAATIEWGKGHNFAGVPEWERRAELYAEDVRRPSRRRPDLRFAPNFSWMIFTERAVMVDYFRSVHADLAEDGLFVFDIYGGWEAAEEMEEKRRIDAGFTYIWQQKAYHPASGFYHCAIHFQFKDGSRLDNVYDYRWRLWSLPEVIDILKDAGFSRVDSYWEGTDPDGVSGNGVFKLDPRGENCPAWVTYVVAQR